MGEHTIKFNTRLESASREIDLTVPINLTAAEGDALKRHIDDLVNTRQPDASQCEHIQTICERFGCTLDEIRENIRRQRDIVVLARKSIVRYMLSEGFGTSAIADFIHREPSAVYQIKLQQT